MVMSLNYIRVFLVVFFACMTASCQKELPSLEELEGLYKYTFPNMLMDGTEYTSANRLVLFQTSPHALYFDTHLDWANGHSCDLSGIAELDQKSQRTLVYSVPSNSGKTCTFTINLKTNKLVFGDSDGVCRLLSCGNRGMLDGVEFQYNTREKIKPADIKKTPGFKRATQEYFESGK